MRLTIYKILPYWLNYTNEGLSDWEGGRTNFLSIKIKPEYKSDISLLMHELEHVKQTYKTLFLHGVLYDISWRYRLWSECKAYLAGQYKYKTMSLEYIADCIYKDYNMGFTKDYIKKYLENMANEN